MCTCTHAHTYTQPFPKYQPSKTEMHVLNEEADFLCQNWNMQWLQRELQWLPWLSFFPSLRGKGQMHVTVGFNPFTTANKRPVAFGWAAKSRCQFGGGWERGKTVALFELRFIWSGFCCVQNSAMTSENYYYYFSFCFNTRYFILGACCKGKVS